MLNSYPFFCLVFVLLGYFDVKCGCLDLRCIVFLVKDVNFIRNSLLTSVLVSGKVRVPSQDPWDYTGYVVVVNFFSFPCGVLKDEALTFHYQVLTCSW